MEMPKPRSTPANIVVSSATLNTTQSKKFTCAVILALYS